MVTQQLLKELFNYNPDTGQFIRLKTLSRRTKVGEVAGTTDTHGYVVITLCGKKYKSHRLAFLYMTGSIPDGEIDHINNDRADNSWKNLRHASSGQNRCNSPAKKRKSSKYKGVYLIKRSGRWGVKICKDYEKVFVGSYTSETAAAKAYNNKAKELFGEYAWLNHIDHEKVSVK